MSAAVLSKQRVAAAIETAEKDLEIWIGLGAGDREYIVEAFDDNSFGLTVGDLRVLVNSAKAVGDVDRLSNIIRAIRNRNTLGAGALADAIVDALEGGAV